MSNILEDKIKEAVATIDEYGKLYRLTEDVCLQFNEWEEYEAWEVQYREQKTYSPKDLFNYFINNIYKP